MIHPYVYAGLPPQNTNSVIETICKYFDVDHSVIITKNRKANIVLARSFIWLFLKTEKVTYNDVNAKMGTGYNHTSIMHGINNIRGYVENDENYAKLYTTLSDMLQTYPISYFKVYSADKKKKLVSIPVPK